MSTKLIKDDYFKDGKPVHLLSYCAFLDILGFSAKIRESYKVKKGNSLLRDFYSIFQERLEKIRSESESSLLYFKTFSDNVLLAYPRYSHDMEEEFAFIMWSLRDYQYQMALKGMFIRGGLSIGPLFVSDDNVYGDALIEAYELESKIAVYPMVILSDTVKKLVGHHVGYYTGEDAPQKRDVLVDAEGRYFINYLTESILEMDDGDEIDGDSLAIHKKRIQEGLKLYVNNTCVYAKYSWLAAYHNFFCDSVSYLPGYKKSLKIKKLPINIQFKKIGEV